jgi:hypothetical protein
MEEDFDAVDIFSVLTSMLRTERSLYGILRNFPIEARAAVMLQHQINNSWMIALLHTSLTQPDSVVINIPYPDEMVDVPVLATAAQIQTAITPNVTVDADAGDCAICQESVGIMTKINRCGHGFHDACIQSWFTRSVRCPVCRWDIRGEE